MVLSNEVISEFVKVTKNDAPKKNESIVYATVVKSDGSTYVKFDGSDLLTPVISTTNVADKERVTVMIKNHTAIVTGNITSPSARTAEVEDVGGELAKAKILIADKVSTAELNAQIGRIDKLESDFAVIGDLEANNVNITGELTAVKADIKDLRSNNVTIDGKITAVEGDIDKLEANDILVGNKLTAAEAEISNLKTDKLSSTDADIKYANIEFANIGEAALRKIYADSGLIRDIIISEGSITGRLVGVTIKGDFIEGGTVVADKLVVKGSDGLYYKLNTDGESVETEQTEYNSLNGSIITAKSITATKISVDDLVAFDATIGGFNITDSAIYSGTKESIDNSTRGMYLGKDGQVAFGDTINHLKYYKDDDGNYKLVITASEIYMASGRSIEEIETKLDGAELAVESAQNAANEATEMFERYIRHNAEGLHIGDNQTSDELLLQSAMLHFILDGKPVSTIAPDYHRFGSMEIRTPVVGGIVIQAVSR